MQNIFTPSRNDKWIPNTLNLTSTAEVFTHFSWQQTTRRKLHPRDSSVAGQKIPFNFEYNEIKLLATRNDRHLDQRTLHPKIWKEKNKTEKEQNSLAQNNCAYRAVPILTSHKG